MKNSVLIWLLLILFIYGCSERIKEPSETLSEETALPPGTNVVKEPASVEPPLIVSSELPAEKPVSSSHPAIEQKIFSEATSEETLPECTTQKYTASPVSFDDLREISPLGSLNPPGHTIPTEHTYLHLQEETKSQKMVDLIASGDIYLTSVSSDPDDYVPERTEYSIEFALCKDVRGYFNHVKEISEELQQVLAKVACEKWTVNPEGVCYKRIFEPVKAGTIIGKVGHKQGNFDFGTVDYRIKSAFLNPARYGDASYADPPIIHKVCPYDYYEGELKEKLYAKLKSNRKNGDRCGKVMQDVAGTLRGNWFNGDAAWDKPDTWLRQLAFVQDNSDAFREVISVGGFFTDAGKWEFLPEDSGTVNREFSQVTADGNIYCYKAAEPEQGSRPEGKILVQLLSDTKLKIEKQSGNCGASESFSIPVEYNR